MMSAAAEDAKPVGTIQKAGMDSKEESPSVNVNSSVNMNNSGSVVAMKETASDIKTNPTADRASDNDAIKENTDTLDAKECPNEELDSSTQIETSMEVDTSTEITTSVQSEHTKCIPDSQESCVYMDTTDVQTETEKKQVCLKEVTTSTAEVQAADDEITANDQASSEHVTACTEEVNTCLKEVNTHTEEVNTRTEEVNTGTEKVNTRTEEVNTRTEEMNTRTEEVNTRTEEVNTRTEEVNTRTEEVNTRTEDVNTRTEDVNTRPEEVNTRTEEVKADTKEVNIPAEEVKVSTKGVMSCTDEQNVKSTVVDERKTVTPSPQEVAPTEEKKCQEENLDDWEVLASDGEEGETSTSAVRTGVFEPPPSVIIELFEKLDKEGVLELDWKCPGRRKPEEDEKEEKQEIEVQPEVKLEEDEQKEEEPTAFDFDVPDPVAKVTPRRLPGNAQAQGSGKKRIARMDKVLQNIIRHKNIDDNDFEFGDDDNNEMDTTPQRKLNKFHIRRDLDA